MCNKQELYWYNNYYYYHLLSERHFKNFVLFEPNYHESHLWSRETKDFGDMGGYNRQPQKTIEKG